MKMSEQEDAGDVLRLLLHGRFSGLGVSKCLCFKVEKILNKNFIDMLSAFLEEKVEFMIVGAVAMAFHGYVRSTGDIDFWIRISDENAERVWALEVGAPTFDLGRATF